MGFFSWMMHPAMLAAGTAAVSLPIIIHLLNRRRFRTVQWAAMDFLLEADRKNRRRVQLEHLILLLLRCLAVLLLGIMLARPFMPGMLASILQQKQQVERVVLLDDSFSQLAPRGEVSGFEAARQSLVQMLERSAASADTDNWITLFLTSQPDQPLIAWEPVTVATVSTLMEQINSLECTQQSANYSKSLGELARYMTSQREGTGRAAYIYSDLRQHDWSLATEGANADSIRASIDEIKRLANKSVVVDTGGSNDGNLAIFDVRSEDLPVANRILRVDVSVTNFGTATATDVPVLLEIDGQTPLRDTIPEIGPGKTEVLAFRHLFQSIGDRTKQLTVAEEQITGTAGPSGIRNHRIQASLDRSSMSEAVAALDVLNLDSQKQLAIRLLDGIPVLLVDGDPSPMPERSETHYLRSLNVFGTGLVTKVVTPADLETVSLSDYRVIFLCNVDEISEDRGSTLLQWVEDGGAVVFMPGNQVRAEIFNQTFYRDGTGLSPVALDRIDGDPSMDTWVNFEPDSQIHPALRTILSSDATGLTRVDIFSWWRTMPLASTAQAGSTTAIRLSDASNSPAMIDRSLGAGRVIFFNIPADGDWTMWPAVTGAWVPVMLDLVDYLAGSVVDSADIRIGDIIQWPVDLTVYQSRVALRDPQQEKTETVARSDGPSGEARDTVLAGASFEEISSSGFYEMVLERIDGKNETVLFAAGLPRDESRLKRANTEDLQRTMFGDDMQIVQPESLVDNNVEGASAEIWPQVVWAILAILAIEQFLAWWFGRRREMPAAGGA